MLFCSNEVHNFVGLFNDPSAGSGQREGMLVVHFCLGHGMNAC